jgi:hypothetical protein
MSAALILFMVLRPGAGPELDFFISLWYPPDAMAAFGAVVALSGAHYLSHPVDNAGELRPIFPVDDRAGVVGDCQANAKISLTATSGTTVKKDICRGFVSVGLWTWERDPDRCERSDDPGGFFALLGGEEVENCSYLV